MDCWGGRWVGAGSLSLVQTYLSAAVRQLMVALTWHIEGRIAWYWAGKREIYMACIRYLRLNTLGTAGMGLVYCYYLHYDELTRYLQQSCSIVSFVV